MINLPLDQWVVLECYDRIRADSLLYPLSFKKGYSNLEVAIEMEYGLEWRGVTSIFLPSNWTHPGNS